MIEFIDDARLYNLVRISEVRFKDNSPNIIRYGVRATSTYASSVPDRLSDTFNKYVGYVDNLLPTATFIIPRDVLISGFVLEWLRFNVEYVNQLDNDATHVITDPFSTLSHIAAMYKLDGVQFHMHSIAQIYSNIYMPLSLELRRTFSVKFKTNKTSKRYKHQEIYPTVDNYLRDLEKSLMPIINETHNIFTFISSNKTTIDDLMNSRLGLTPSTSDWPKLTAMFKMYSISTIEQIIKHRNIGSLECDERKILKLTKLINAYMSPTRTDFSATVNNVKISFVCGTTRRTGNQIMKCSVRFPAIGVVKFIAYDCIDEVKEFSDSLARVFETLGIYDMVYNKLEIAILQNT